MFNKKFILFILFFSILVSTAYAQDSTGISLAFKPQDSTNAAVTRDTLLIPPDSLHLKKGINYTALSLYGGFTVAAFVIAHKYHADTWWEEKTGTFKVQNDWEYAAWADKAGHFFAPNIGAHYFTSILKASDVPDETSFIIGSSLAFLYQMYIEVQDGYAPWGFSPGDAIADFLGAGYYLSQYYFPYLKNIQPRMSYYPAKSLSNKTGNFTDDYNSQKYWFALRLKKMLPKSIAEYWPSFLMVSVGFGVKEYMDGTAVKKRKEYFIALDFDPEVIPLKGKIWQFVKDTFQYLHFPMPGIRISPNTAVFMFTF